MPEEAIHTATFIEHMDMLFDTWNSVVQGVTKKFKRPIAEGSIHWAHLQHMKNVFENLKIVKVEMVKGRFLNV